MAQIWVPVKRYTRLVLLRMHPYHRGLWPHTKLYLGIYEHSLYAMAVYVQCRAAESSKEIAELKKEVEKFGSNFEMPGFDAKKLTVNGYH